MSAVGPIIIVSGSFPCSLYIPCAKRDLTVNGNLRQWSDRRLRLCHLTIHRPASRLTSLIFPSAQFCQEVFGSVSLQTHPASLAFWRNRSPGYALAPSETDASGIPYLAKNISSVLGTSYSLLIGKFLDHPKSVTYILQNLFPLNDVWLDFRVSW
jgi:hypothetical protein